MIPEQGEQDAQGLETQATQETSLPLFAEEENPSAIEEEPTFTKPIREPKEKKQEEKNS